MALEAADVGLGWLGDEPKGSVIVDRQMIFVSRPLQRQPEAVARLSPLGAGGGRRQKGGQTLGERVAFPDGRLGRALAGVVVLAQREKAKLRPDPPRLLDVCQPHCSPVGPGTEEVDVDGRLTDAHAWVEWIGIDCRSNGM